MNLTIWPKSWKLNIQNRGASAALIILAITQVPVAIKTAAEVACIGEISNKIWSSSNSHKGVNISAVNICNGGEANTQILSDLK